MLNMPLGQTEKIPAGKSDIQPLPNPGECTPAGIPGCRGPLRSWQHHTSIARSLSKPTGPVAQAWSQGQSADLLYTCSFWTLNYWWRREKTKKIHSHSTIMIHRPDPGQVWCFHRGQANIAREKSLRRHLSKVFRLAWAPFKASGWNQSVMKAVVKFAFLLDDRLKVEVIYLNERFRLNTNLFV